MIVNPYNELISLHDAYIEEIKIINNSAHISINQAFFISDDDYVLDKPSIIANDLINSQSNMDYPLRIKLFNDDKVINLSLDELSDYSFCILEEAYGFGLVHFYGFATDRENSYDFIIDIHFSGKLEIKWDDKYLVEAYK